MPKKSGQNYHCIANIRIQVEMKEKRIKKNAEFANNTLASVLKCKCS